MKKVFALTMVLAFFVVGLCFAEQMVEVVDKGQSGGGINFRSAPRISPDTFIQHFGMDATFKYLGDAGAFYKVEKDGTVGYVHKSLTTVTESAMAPADTMVPAPADTIAPAPAAPAEEAPMEEDDWGDEEFEEEDW